MAKKDKRDAVVVWPEGDLRRGVVLDGTEVTLVRRDGAWGVSDEERLASEARLLDALGQPNEALERARGVVGALNADLVRPDQVGGLARRLACLWMMGPHGYSRLGADERDALAVACAHLSSDAAFGFLSWVLAKRLEPALGRTPWMPPGWHSWNSAARWEFDRTIAQRLGSGFFDAMAAHGDRRFGDLAVATDPDADPQRLGELSADGDAQLRDLVAVNPATPVEALQQLSSAPVRSFSDAFVRLRVLQNPSTPAWLVALAALGPVDVHYREPDWRYGRAEVFQRVWGALHPRAPMSLLRGLASHSDPTVRATVARTPRTPIRVLEALAPSLDTEVRAGVAQNLRASARLLEALAADRHRTVRAAVAANPAAPPGALRWLAGDAVAAVRAEAAMNEATPPGTLRVLCDDADVLTAAAAAANPSTHRTAMGPIAERLARADVWLARAIAADLPETPAAVLGLLAADPRREVREGAAGNPRTPPQALWALARRAKADR
ncbi:hypothetical protein [Candidatus Poriferisodalis sp.]|uniref:hypothetical protein n=1 Tax=Candidatus Poriferisodalis sp. TaxID=3101277 RepID=UPI003D126D1C